jgi:hypothetical protein
MNWLRYTLMGGLILLMTTTAVAGQQRAPYQSDYALYLPFVLQPHEPQIISFQVEPNLADPGQTVTLSWEVAYADQITLTRFWDYRPAEWWTDLPLTDVHSYTIPTWERNPVMFMLDAYNSATDTRVMASVSIQVVCPDVWFFEPAPSGCPTAPLISPAAEQAFEGGYMIWLGAENRIIVLYSDTAYATKVSNFMDDWDGSPICDLGPPPEGKLHPERGFGHIWCTHQIVRDRLGWAIEPEIGYETILQRTTLVKYNHTYLRAADGNVWHLLPESSGWEKIIVTP